MTDPWRYADRAELADPEAVCLLVQAVQTPARGIEGSRAAGGDMT